VVGLRNGDQFVTGVDNLFSCTAHIAYIIVPNKLKNVIKKVCMKCRRGVEGELKSACV